MTKEESDAALAAKQLDSQIEIYYCVECKEEFGKNDTEWPEHEDHDGFRKITVFQGWVVDEIKAALESKNSKVVLALADDLRGIAKDNNFEITLGPHSWRSYRRVIKALEEEKSD